MKKKIIFFDGDGTLWYPKKTKRKKHPVWIYLNPKIAKNYKKHLVMTPTSISTIKRLKKRGIILVILSTSPRPPKEAKVVINGTVKYFFLENLFDEVHATREYHGSKGEFILKILKGRKIPKSKALMVGDSYSWDYKPAKDRGVDALLIISEYEPMKIKVKRTIKKLKDIFEYI